ncbi:MAG TPA: hypothetical protein VGG39_04330 [Polyangiaceae bacterium]|jgi:hypothetical protein
MKSDRPTVPPSFDVERYAKESDAKLATARAVPVPAVEEEFDPTVSGERLTPQSAIRIATRPQLAAVQTDEGWARSMDGMPVVVMPADVLKKLPLDHRAGFLLSLMDGAIDLETMVEIAAMPRDEVLRLVRDLFESGVVDFRPA